MVVVNSRQDTSRMAVDFETLLHQIETNPHDIDFLGKRLITPFSPYYLCNHFVGGDEWTGRKPPVPTSSNNLLENNNIETLKEMEIIHVQNHYLDDFMVRFLPNISCRFILMTGQWHLPQLHLDDSRVQQFLDDPRVHRWFSQNPILEHPKYRPFPYGLLYDSLPSYANALLRSVHTVKTKNIVTTPLNRATHPCRLLFDPVPQMHCDAFYQTISEAKFALSPIGDRNDTYRHYECIGLGTIPIANTGKLYQKIFGDSMMYVDTAEEMVALLHENPELPYSPPSRDLVSLQYWADYIQQNS